jgi:hypothetical protein
MVTLRRTRRFFRTAAEFLIDFHTFVGVLLGLSVVIFLAVLEALHVIRQALQ